MPIIKSAKKALKQSFKRKARNDHFKRLYRELRVDFEKAIKEWNLEKATEVFFNKKEEGKNIKSGLQSTIDKLAKKNIIHKNNASRKKSKFAWMLKKLALNS